MGRMKRQRRYKACDPFSTAKKTDKEKDKYDRAPKGKGKGSGGFDEHLTETQRFKRFQLSIEKAKPKLKVNRDIKVVRNAPKVLQKSKKSKEESEGDCSQKLPHETKNEYFQRLDQNIDDAINKSMIQNKPLRKKRKMHLQARNEKKKMKKQEANADCDSPLKDTFTFGETVSEPPTISTAPRKASTHTNKFQDLKLTSLLKNDTKKASESKEENKAKEQEAMVVERQNAIDAYRLMKKRKMARYVT